MIPHPLQPGHATDRLAALGEGLRAHANLIRWLQCWVVLVYGVLLLLPVLLPLPDDSLHIWEHITSIAAFVFWGLWWPFVLLSMLIFGRLWCGVLCPEGALSEWASRHGLARPIPRWMRWGGWPFVAFTGTTVYGQMISVYQYPKPALLILGGSTVAAMAVGYLYTQGKRAWCRYLCPVNGVFGLLSKLAPVHFRVNESAWHDSMSRHPPTSAKAVNCAPLLDIRHMQSSSCHMCGRCSQHRQAVTLAWRRTSDEVVHQSASHADKWQTLLIVYGLMGVAIGAFHWSASPWFVAVKQSLSEWLINNRWDWPLQSNAPWWLLTHYPEKNDLLTWLDGGLLLVYITVTAMVMGSVSTALLAISVRSAGAWQSQRMHHLAQALIPLAGCGVFLGLSAITLSQLQGEGLRWAHVNHLRLLVLLASNLWSLRLGMAILQSWSKRWRACVSTLCFSAVLLWVDSAWACLFWWW